MLLVGSNGCMTYSLAQVAQGHPEKSYFSKPIANDPKPIANDNMPHPVYYCWLPLTIPADIVTSPIQLIVFAGGYVFNQLFNLEGI
jgi:hypothetical protein